MQIEVSSVNCHIKIAQPLNVNKVDHQAYIKELMKAGAPVNVVIGIATDKSILIEKARDASITNLDVYLTKVWVNK